MDLKESRFSYVENVKQETARALMGITSADFKNGWNKPLDKGISTNGEYFEED